MKKIKANIDALMDQYCKSDAETSSVLGLLGDKQLILYGAGELGVTFIIRIVNRYNRVNIMMVLDRKFKHPQVFHGISACSPDEYHPSEKNKKDSLVIVAVLNESHQQEIISKLRCSGYRNIMLATDIYELQLLHIPKGLLDNGREYYLSEQKRIVQALELFDDKISRETFNLFLSTHIKREFIRFPSISSDEQYFPSDIKMNKGYARLINCGAYNGDTVMRLNEKYGKIKALACFEPDLESFYKLVTYLRDKGQGISDVILTYPCGVHGTTKRFYFADADASSMITDDGDLFVQCVSLDDVLSTFNPTFINMDIEGAELDALKGAEQILKKCKPDLAICVYHAPNHIWDVPLYLNSLKLEYKFYLRTYTYFTNETVLYATVDA